MSHLPTLIADLAHLDEETALKISSSFGGGMGHASHAV